MIHTILEIGIASLLVIGSYQDIKTRTVSNKITGSIAVLSLIYFLLLPYITYVSWHFYWLHILIIVGMFISYKLNAIGGADIKALLPLIYTFSTIPLFFFLVISTIIHSIIHIRYDKQVPYFIAMTAAFLLIKISFIQF